MELITATAADWIEVLGGMPQQAIHQACIRYLRDEPRRRPTPGAILELARMAMPAPAVVRVTPKPEPERPRMTGEQANAILERAGFRPKKIRGDDE